MNDKIITHYRIVEKISEGGMGTVYKAEDLTLERTVALKFLPSKLGSESNLKDRFINEAKALATLNHPNVATIFGIEESDETAFIVMEYVEGCDLRRILTDYGANTEKYYLPIEKTLRIAEQVIDGLQAAHEKLIVHRDIKPENIMINSRGRVKILDFGIAKISGKNQLTKTGTTVGTIAYMSPEQSTGQQVDQRTDIWSLGVILYEMFTGRRPFRGTYDQAVIYSILHDNPEPLEKYRTDIPANLNNIVSKALSKKQEDRYSGCEELLKDLKALDFQNKPAERSENHNPAAAQNPLRIPLKKNYKNFKWYVSTIKKRLRISWGIIVAVVILFLISFFVYNSSTTDNQSDRKKIAVLPFINMSNDPNDEYFTDGIMEDILTELVKISDLKVISRTTMIRYKNTTKSLDEISKELNTDVVLEGSVRRDSAQLRITVQLIDSKTDEHIWADTYDIKPERIFIIQSKIALKIAGTLQARLSNDEKVRIEKSTVSNPEVHNLILKGRYFVNQLDSISVAKAIELYSNALMIEPKNADALTHLANAYIVQTDMGYTDLNKGYPKARKLVMEALEIDNDLAVAHTVLGMIRVAYDWDWSGAEKEFQKAIKIEPGNTTTLNQMGQLARTLGKIDEAIVLMQRAVELDPVSVVQYLYLGHFQMYANRLKDAVATLNKGLELSPRYPYMHYILGCTYLLMRKPDKALNEINMEPVESFRSYVLPMLYSDLGNKTRADSLLNDCISRYQDIGSFNIAEIYAYRGDVDLAFEWLDKAYENKDGSLPYIKGDPFLKNIENDPRYVSFLQKINL